MSEVKACNNTLTGSISNVCSLSGTISVAKGTDAQLYTGDYEVVPNAYRDSILPTAGKVLKDDIVIAKVPYYETSNSSDGITVFIAEPV